MTSFPKENFYKKKSKNIFIHYANIQCKLSGSHKQTVNFPLNNSRRTNKDKIFSGKTMRKRYIRIEKFASHINH